MRSNDLIELLIFLRFENYKYVEKEISKCFEVCGFVSISELATPQTYARHLVFYGKFSKLLTLWITLC